MHARVGHGLFPGTQERVLLVQAGDTSAFQGVFLHIINATFHLALVPGGVGPRGQQGDAVVVRERAHLWIDVGIKPVGLRDRGLEVVQDHLLGHAAKGPEGVLQTADEVLSGLPPDRLAVALARIAQHHAKDVAGRRLPSTSIMAPVPKSTWTSWPGRHSRRRKGKGVCCSRRWTKRRTL